MVRDKFPRCVKIDEKYIELYLPSAKAVQMIQERLGGKGRIPPKL
jgi:hypothetical protein